METEKLPGPLERASKKYIDLSFNHPWLLLCFFALVALVCSWFAYEKLSVSTDLRALLPEETASVKALEQSKRRIGSTDFFVIAIQSHDEDPFEIARAQDLLKDRIEAEWSDAKWAQVDRDISFFKNHALYYFSGEKLRDLKNILEEEYIRASAKSVPGLVNLMDTSEDDKPDLRKRIAAWCDEDTVSKMGFPPQIEEHLLNLFSPLSSTNEENRESEGDTLPKELSNRLIGQAGDVGVVLVQLDSPSTDLEYARFALERGEALIEDFLSKSEHGSVSAQVVGAYRSFREVDSISSDGKMATTISVSLILFILLLFFRSPRSVAVIFLPLTVAASLTMAATALFYGRLTVLTVFVLAMLAGMGIDYGVHLFGRVRRILTSGESIRVATHRALVETGGAVLAASATTIASLLTLIAGHFEGFREFGVVAAYGLSLCVFMTIAMLPPLIGAMERIRPYTLFKRQSNRTLRFAQGLARFRVPLFVMGILFSSAAIFFAPEVTFENDFRNLRGPKTGAKIGYGRAIGKKASTTPAVILGRDKKQMRAAHDLLLSKLDDPMLSSFITLYTFVPPSELQESRHRVIKEIGEIAHRRALNGLRGEDRLWVNKLRIMSEATPFKDQDLPAWSRRIVSEANGEVGKIGHLYSKVEDWNAYSVQDFQNRFAYLQVDGDPLTIANSAFILADVVKMVRGDGTRLFALTGLVLLLVLALYARSFKGALILLFCVSTSALWTAGVMGALELRVGLYNVIVIPVILGVSIDTAIHLYHTHRRLGSKRLADNFATTGIMVVASSLTTLCGFFGLLFVSHLGLRTIGQLACVGVLTSLLSTLAMLPFLLGLMKSRNHQRENELQ